MSQSLVTVSFPNTAWRVAQFSANHQIHFPHRPDAVAEDIMGMCVCVCVYSLVSVWTGARALIIFGTVNIWAVVEGAIPSADGSAAPLVQEVPVEAGEGPVLRAFMLNEERALLRPKLLQISAAERHKHSGIASRVKFTAE